MNKGMTLSAGVVALSILFSQAVLVSPAHALSPVSISYAMNGLWSRPGCEKSHRGHKLECTQFKLLIRQQENRICGTYAISTADGSEEEAGDATSIRGYTDGEKGVAILTSAANGASYLMRVTSDGDRIDMYRVGMLDSGDDSIENLIPRTFTLDKRELSKGTEEVVERGWGCDWPY